MSAHRHRLTYNSLTMNGIYVPGNTGTEGASNLSSAYAESDIRVDGMDVTRLSTQDMRELKQFQEGANPNEIFEGIRTIHLWGKIYGSSYGDLEDKAWAMHLAFSPAEVRRLSTAALVGTYPDEPAGVLPLDFTRDTASVAAGVARRFYCRPNIGRPLVVGKKGDGLVRPWQAWLVAYDPRCYSQQLNSQALASLTGSNNTIANAGNATTYPQIKVKTDAAAGNSATTLTNSTTGQALVMDLDPLGVGSETFWIFPERGEMVRGNGDGRYYYRTSGFLDNLFLVPGNNVWTWSHTTGIDTVTFYWRDAYA
jgi:hypothetical protein